MRRQSDNAAQDIHGIIAFFRVVIEELGPENRCTQVASGV
jgi:hypothetical protein